MVQQHLPETRICIPLLAQPECMHTDFVAASELLAVPRNPSAPPSVALLPTRRLIVWSGREIPAQSPASKASQSVYHELSSPCTTALICNVKCGLSNTNRARCRGRNLKCGVRTR
eukprot:6175828-Pleurochrysis_carterae.AAC.1